MTTEKKKLEKVTEIEIPKNTSNIPAMNFFAGDLFLNEYRIINQMPVVGGEADVFKLENGQIGAKFILKLYHYGISPKSEVMEKILSLKSPGIVKLEKYGYYRFGNIKRFYEIQEFIPHGSLAEYCAQNRVSKDEVRNVLFSLNQILYNCHLGGLIHRDLKPANILLRTLSPLTPVLTDFGIASVLAKDVSRRFTSRSRTIDYAAPEALSGVVGKEMDYYWSLGIIIAELLLGKHPFADMSDSLINLYLTSKPMPIPENVQEDWKYLLKGLLTRDFKGRWGYEQVSTWLSGKYMEIPLFYEGETVTPLDHAAEEITGNKPYRFNNKNIYSIKALTEELLKDYEKAVKHLLRGYIGKWVENQIQNYELKSDIDDILEDNKMSDARKLTVFLYKANPAMPLTYKDKIFTNHNLTIWLQNIIAGNETKEDIDLLNELIPEKLYIDYSLETNRFSMEEAQIYKQKFDYAIKNICNKQPFPNISIAYLFLLIINEDSRQIAFNSLHERICAATATVLNAIFKGSDKPVEAFTKENLLIIFFLKYGQEKTEKIIRKLDNRISLEKLNLIEALLKVLLQFGDDFKNNDLVEIISKKLTPRLQEITEISQLDVIRSTKNDDYRLVINSHLNIFPGYEKKTWVIEDLAWLKKAEEILHIPEPREFIIKATLKKNILKGKSSLESLVIENNIPTDEQTNKKFSRAKELLSEYINKDIDKLDAKDFQWNSKVSELLPKAASYISKNELARMISNTKTSLESLITKTVPNDKKTEKAFDEAKTLLNKYIFKEPHKLVYNDYLWYKSASETLLSIYSLSETNGYIDKKVLYENISRIKLRLKSLITENVPWDEATRYVFNEAKVLLEGYSDKEVELLDVFDLQWDKTASEILSKHLNYKNRKDLLSDLQDIKEKKTALEKLIAGNVPKDERTKRAFDEAEVLLKKYIIKDLDTFDINDIGWLKVASDILSQNMDYVSKQKWAEEVIQKINYIKEFSQNMKIVKNLTVSTPIRQMDINSLKINRLHYIFRIKEKPIKSIGCELRC